MAKQTSDPLARSYDARQKAWEAWGEVSPDVLTHLLNPSLAGGPRWPAMRQAFRTARKDGQLLLASDGLSDPWDDGSEGNGLGLELFAITGDPIEQIPGSWLWDMVWQMSQFAAKHGGIANLVDDLAWVSTELYDVKIPPEHAKRFVSDQERVGVLLGLTAEPIPETIEGPLSEIMLVNVKLLTRDELSFVARGGEQGREELARRFGAQADALASSLTRPSVV